MCDGLRIPRAGSPERLTIIISAIQKFFSTRLVCVMYKKKSRGWEKHLDFILLDLICLEAAFFLGYNLRRGSVGFRENEIYQSMFFVLPIIGLLVSVFGNGFKNVLKRGIVDELGAVLKQVLLVFVLGIVYLFVQHSAWVVSRLLLMYTAIFYAAFSFAARLLWKHHLHKKMSGGGRVSLLIVTTPGRLRNVKRDVIEHNYAMYSFDGIALVSEDCGEVRPENASVSVVPKSGQEVPENASDDAAPKSLREETARWTYGIGEGSSENGTDEEAALEGIRGIGAGSSADGIPGAGTGTSREEAEPDIESSLKVGDEYAGTRIVADENTLIDYLMESSVDEVLFDVREQNEGSALTDLINTTLTMGITTHVRLAGFGNMNARYQSVGKLGNCLVYTAALRDASPGQLAAKRLLDILGGLIGCAITGVLAVIFGPVIYRKSPGASIFFHQTRIGQNGKKFEMYKFRSMYPDAEERKKELMKENRVKDEMMFKLDYDPRIIGCYKDKNGVVHKGIGNFIREKSIDEFPQFWNVLKGDMSMVGTRPPTLDEWEKYEPYMRGRMSCKPGITGLWQVSGRSEITDFDEVVKLDLEYIEHWDLRMDIRILIRTIKVVVKGEGAM